jgi:hypothetical protein
VLQQGYETPGRKSENLFGSITIASQPNIRFAKNLEINAGVEKTFPEQNMQVFGIFNILVIN